MLHLFSPALCALLLASIRLGLSKSTDGSATTVSGVAGSGVCLLEGEQCPPESESAVHASVLLQSDARRSGASQVSRPLQSREVIDAKEGQPYSVEKRIAQLEERIAGLEEQKQTLERTRSNHNCATLDGTPCMFGIDERDEGGHCILDAGDFGAFGWCYTNEYKTAWGPCRQTCPFFGPEKVLSRKLDTVSNKLYELLEIVDDMPENCCGKSKAQDSQVVEERHGPKEQGKSSPKKGGKESPASSRSEGKSEPQKSDQSDSKRSPGTPGKSAPKDGGATNNLKEMMLLLRNHGARKRSK